MLFSCKPKYGSLISTTSQLFYLLPPSSPDPNSPLSSRHLHLQAVFSCKFRQFSQARLLWKWCATRAAPLSILFHWTRRTFRTQQAHLFVPAGSLPSVRATTIYKIEWVVRGWTLLRGLGRKPPQNSRLSCRVDLCKWATPWQTSRQRVHCSRWVFLQGNSVCPSEWHFEIRGRLAAHTSQIRCLPGKILGFATQLFQLLCLFLKDST